MKLLQTVWGSIFFVIMLGLGGMVIVIMLGMYIETFETWPKNAQVYVNPVNGDYLSPPCYIASKHGLFVLTDWHRAKELMLKKGIKLKPDHDCRDDGGLVGPSQSLLRYYLFPKASRWNPDGSWRW